MDFLKTIFEYFLNIKPLTFKIWGGVFLGSAIIALITTLLYPFFKKQIPSFYKTLGKKIRYALTVYALVSLFLYFIRQQRIPYLSMRLWLWIWVLAFSAIVGVIAYKEIKEIPNKKEKIKKQEKFKRYFES